MSNEISTQVEQVTQENSEDAIAMIVEAFYDIPFENSAFQTENFVLAASITPERAYRGLGLRLQSRLQALQEAKFSAMKEQIDIEELQAKIENPNTDSFERRRAEIDIMQKVSAQGFTRKLINDAVVECNLLYAHFKKFPRYTREEFEAGERQHFQLRLQRAVDNVQGAAESLVNMNSDVLALQQFEAEIAPALIEAKAQALLGNGSAV